MPKTSNRLPISIAVVATLCLLIPAQRRSRQYDETARQIRFVTERLSRETSLPDSADAIHRETYRDRGSIVIVQLRDVDGWGYPLLAVYVQPPGGNVRLRVLSQPLDGRTPRRILQDWREGCE